MRELSERCDSAESCEGAAVSEQNCPGDHTSDLESELITDQSVLGSPLLSAMDNSSPTNSGPDSEAASVDDLPKDNKTETNQEILSNKVAAATNYMGSFFNPSAWKPTAAAEATPEEEKSEGDRKNSSGSIMSSSLFSAIGKVPGFSKISPTEESKAGSDEKPDNSKEEDSSLSTGGSFFSSAFSKINISGMTSSLTTENIAEAEEDVDKNVKSDETWGSSFSSAFTKVGKVATDYTKVVQDSVYKAPLMAEFNKEQEDFIKNKGETEIPTAPWSGYHNEEELKDKIIALSEDKRNFLRAPPTGVNFDFEYSAVASHAVVLLQADARLSKMRYELVPKKVKEDEFWRNYFYRLGLIKQSFELSNSMSAETTTKKEKPCPLPKAVDDDTSDNPTATDGDDEFVSELHQASSKDVADADEALKKLGLAKNDAEWEAELEGELNEYEMVGEDGAAPDGEDNPEWENQIQEMLDAESKK